MFRRRFAELRHTFTNCRHSATHDGVRPVIPIFRTTFAPKMYNVGRTNGLVREQFSIHKMDGEFVSETSFITVFIIMQATALGNDGLNPSEMVVSVVPFLSLASSTSVMLKCQTRVYAESGPLRSISPSSSVSICSSTNFHAPSSHSSK